jgi:protein O-mannosyl-transferase
LYPNERTQNMMLKGQTKHFPYYLAGLAALLTFLVFLPDLQNDFVEWDDNDYIFENPHIRSIGPDFFNWAFTSFHVANWHPLTWVSHALDSRSGG